MHDAGYMYGWSSDASLKHWIEEGWEIVLEPRAVGAFAMIRMRADGRELTLFMKKWSSPRGTDSRQADVR